MPLMNFRTGMDQQTYAQRVHAEQSGQCPCNGLKSPPFGYIMRLNGSQIILLALLLNGCCPPASFWVISQQDSHIYIMPNLDSFDESLMFCEWNREHSRWTIVSTGHIISSVTVLHSVG